MGIAPDKIVDIRLKHLELIQAVIARMSNQRATVKNYCITITTAVCGFAVTTQHPIVSFLSLLPIVIFGLVDVRIFVYRKVISATFRPCTIRGVDVDANV